MPCPQCPNLLKPLHRKKGWIVAALFLVGKIAFAQLPVAPSSTEIALAGSGAARAGELPFARVNPALAGTVGRRLHASASPSSLGIAGYVDGSLLATLPLDSTFNVGVNLEGLSAATYRQVRGGGMVAFSPDRFITLGAAIALNSVNIESYGSAVAPTLDVGLLVRPAAGIRIGGAATNLTRATVANEPLPQTLAVGFAFDLSPATSLSIDMSNQIGHAITTSLGFSTWLLPELMMRGGVGHYPTNLSLGFGYRFGEYLIEYGGAWVNPVGLRHSVGVGVAW
ncbi:MAG: hypothetical protein IPM61_10860 [Chlorobi bacterium]|nr:hypothetical protein [Chlorobiota bacterium]MBX7218066.1 hypothetical protein [Candidatus Kapabacteria bacterium]